MKKLMILMITAFIDMAGLLMIIPVLPFYATSLGASPFVYGLLLSSFSIAQLLTAPLWGGVSDRYGRRPALLIGLAGSAIAYVVFAYANSLWLLFLSRLIQGAGGGTTGVIQAYVADAVPPKDRAKGLGWVSAATNAGVAIGPVIGSAAMTMGVHGPGLAGAALCLLNMLFAWRFLTESRDMEQARKHVPTPGRGWGAIIHVVTHPSEPASRLIWIYAIAMGAFTGFNAIFALFLGSRFGVTAATIGIFYTYVGTISMVTRVGILGWAVSRFGEARLSRFGMALLAIGLVSLPFMHPMADPASFAARLGGILPVRAVSVLPYLPLAVAIALIPLGTAFTFPCVTGLLSRVIQGGERGLYMGVQQTFGGLARVIFPAIAGLAYGWYLPLPFFISAALVTATIVLGLGMGGYTRPSPTEETAANAA